MYKFYLEPRNNFIKWFILFIPVFLTHWSLMKLSFSFTIYTFHLCIEKKHLAFF